MSSGQNSNISKYQNRNLVINNGDSLSIGNNILSTKNIGNVFTSFIDSSFGQIDMSGNLSIDNGNILVNSNIMFG